MKKEDLKELPKKKKKMDGGGRKPRLPDVETVLLAWIDELRAGHLRITCNGIQMPYIADHSIHHQNKENSTPQAVLLGIHWQHGQDTAIDGYAWGDNHF